MNAIPLSNLIDVPIIVGTLDDRVRSFRPQGRFAFPLLITSQADKKITWPHDAPLVLSYRWFDSRGECVVSDGWRTPMPVSALVPGVSVKVDLIGVTPQYEGAFELQVSLLLEGVHWACDVSSSGWSRVLVMLNPPLAWPIDLVASPGAKALRGALAAAEIARRIKNKDFFCERSPLTTASENAATSTVRDDSETGSASPADEASVRLPYLDETIEDMLAFGSRQGRRISELLAIVGGKDRHIRALEEQIELSCAGGDIPLPAVGMVLVRTSFGFLAIQDDDPAAIAFHSSQIASEAGTVAVVDRLLEPGDCFIDVGANVGIYSLIAGRRVGPRGKILAVEPTPSTMRALRTTLAINGLSQVVDTHECALGREEGTATLYREVTSGHNSLLAPAEGTRTPHVVAVQRGDELLEQTKPSLIKIDVEGWELEVLEGLSRVLKRNKELSVVIEYSPEHIRRRGLRPAQWLETLHGLALKMWVIEDADVSLRPLKKGDEPGDTTVNLLLARELPARLLDMVRPA